MSKHYRIIVSITAALALAFLFMACGGSGGGSSVTYNGSTDPAVADSTTALTLAEYGLGAMQSGFPLVGPFVAPPPGFLPVSLSAQPLAWAATTTVIIPVPSEAVYSGADYDETYGTGTADLNGTLTLYLGTDSAESDTWQVIYGELDGSIVFKNFRIEEGPAVTGTVTVPYGQFLFSGDATFLMSTMSIPDNPGFLVWEQLEMTFTKISVSEGSESWSLGEGDWAMEIAPGSSVSLNINSLTVKYEGSTYKLEGTNLYVEFGGVVPTALAAAQPLVIPDVTSYQISGIVEDCGTFYHPELGVIYFSGYLTEENPPGDIVEGELNFFDDVTEGNSLFFIYFGYDPAYNDGQGATVYELNMDTEEYFEIGYFIDGTFIKDPSAPPVIG